VRSKQTRSVLYKVGSCVKALKVSGKHRSETRLYISHTWAAALCIAEVTRL